jgi:hypothetical protein
MRIQVIRFLFQDQPVSGIQVQCAAAQTQLGLGKRNFNAGMTK